MTKLKNTVLTEWGWRVAYSIIEQSQKGRVREIVVFFFFKFAGRFFLDNKSSTYIPDFSSLSRWSATLKRGQESCGCSASAGSQRRRQLPKSKWFSKTYLIGKPSDLLSRQASEAGGHVKWHRAHLGESDLFAKKEEKKENPQIPQFVPNVLALTDQGRPGLALFKKQSKMFRNSFWILFTLAGLLVSILFLFSQITFEGSCRSLN